MFGGTRSAIQNDESNPYTGAFCSVIALAGAVVCALIAADKFSQDNDASGAGFAAGGTALLGMFFAICCCCVFPPDNEDRTQPTIGMPTGADVVVTVNNLHQMQSGNQKQQFINCISSL